MGGEHQNCNVLVLDHVSIPSILFVYINTFN